MREPGNRGAAVIDRVAAGESLTVTRGGRVLAERRPKARAHTFDATIAASAIASRLRRDTVSPLGFQGIQGLALGSVPHTLAAADPAPGMRVAGDPAG